MIVYQRTVFRTHLMFILLYGTVGEDWVAVVVHLGILNYTHTYQLQNVIRPQPSMNFSYFTSFTVDPMTGDFFLADSKC